MKVLYITEFYPPLTYGGGEIGAKTLAEEMAKTHEIIVLTSHKNNLKKEETKNKVKILRLLKTGNTGSILNERKRMKNLKKSLEKKLPKIIKKENPDLIHLLNTSSIDAIKNMDINIPKIATINSYRNLCPKGNLFYMGKRKCKGAKFKKCMACMLKSKYFGKTKINPIAKPFLLLPLYKNFQKRRKALLNLDKIIAISSFVKQSLINSGIPKDKIKTIPNPMRINDKTKRKTRFNKNKTNFTFIGALEKFKGINELIETFKKYKNKKANLHIIGKGSQEKCLKKTSKNDKRIKFHGKIEHENMPSVYKQSNAVIIPSIWPEPLSRVGLEALFFGKPVIASNTGGNKDLIENNGILYKNEKELLNSFDKINRKMGRNSKQLYKKRFSIKENIKEIENLYQKLGEMK